MTELGVYILGATALAILAAAGINAGNSAVVNAAVVASGAAYLSQVFAAYHSLSAEPSPVARVMNGALMLIAFGAWVVGIFNLL